MASIPRVPGFILTEKLGSGSYATVYKAFRKGNGTLRQVVAVKCVEKASLSKSAIENLLTEIALLKRLKHDHIVEMKDFMWDERYIFIVMEYCGGGDLSHWIKSRKSLPEKHVKRFLQQLAKALQFLRSENICHMDLKPQNILLSSPVNPVLKLADFGFAQYLNTHDDATSLRGSPLYMAPEILLRHKYDARVDLWSVGVILYECLFGQAPYSSKTFSELAEKIKDPRPIEIPYGVRISSKCRDLLHRLLERDPDKRITFDDFFKHEFLDLNHMASPDCYSKAVDLFTKAVKSDEKGEYTIALKFYCEALQYLVPAIQYETDQTKKDGMRQKATEYMSRAEQLKQLLKPSSSQLQDKVNLSPYDELVKMSSDNPHLLAALKVAHAAEDLEIQERLEDAIEKYRLALGAVLPIMSAEPKCRKKDLMLTEVQRWMERAEAIQLYLTTKNALPEESSSPDPIDAPGNSSLRPCVIQ